MVGRVRWGDAEREGYRRSGQLDGAFNDESVLANSVSTSRFSVFPCLVCPRQGTAGGREGTAGARLGRDAGLEAGIVWRPRRRAACPALPHVLLCCGSIASHDDKEPPRANRRPRPGRARRAGHLVRLLVTGPSPLTIDGPRWATGCPPGRSRSVNLRALLLQRSTPYGARDAAVAGLLCRARHRGGAWTVGLAGVLAPGLRRVAAALAATTRAARPIVTRGAGRPAGFGDEQAPCVRLTTTGSAEAPDRRLGCGARLQNRGDPRPQAPHEPATAVLP
jgi:hypothetical protein